MEVEQKIDIVVVNWNSGAQLRRCLASIGRWGRNLVATVIVVDNGSSDDSLTGLEGIDIPLRIRPSATNLGFARACNRGAREGRAPFLLFLNPDTELYPNSLERPLSFLLQEGQSRVGICGIQVIDERGGVARACARFPTLGRFAAQMVGINKIAALKGSGVVMEEWDHRTSRTVDHVIGAFFFVRRLVFETLGGFDERFFLYLEDIDFSLRSKRAGWDSVYLADARVFHKGGGTSQNVAAKRLFYALQSRLIYGYTHFPPWQAWLLAGLTFLLEPVTRSIFSCFRGGRRDLADTLAAYGRLIRYVLRNRQDRAREP